MLHERLYFKENNSLYSTLNYEVQISSYTLFVRPIKVKIYPSAYFLLFVYGSVVVAVAQSV
jgi:hypothetical protein